MEVTSVLVRVVRQMRRPLAPGAWIADKDDQRNIGDPLARIAARHAPLDGGEGSADVMDGMAAMAGVAAYAIKNIDSEGEPVPVDDHGQPIEVTEVPADMPPAAPGWPVG